MDLSVIVPVYKEEGNVGEFVRRVTPILEAITPDFEIIFALDPSPDRTEEVILEHRQADARIKLLKFSRRFGQPMATLAGLQYCRGAAAVVMDVDLQDPPELIGEMVAKWHEGYDVVMARRRTRTGETLPKRIVAGLGYRLINRIADVNIPPNTGDFRLLSRRVIDEVVRLKECHGFLRGLVALVGFKQTAIFFDRPPRFAGQGNYNRFMGSLRIGLNGIICFSTYLLTLSTQLGFITALLAFLMALIYGVMKLMDFPFPMGNPTVVLLILFMGGVQLISVGILGEYISRIYDEVRQRPKFIVDSAVGFATQAATAPAMGCSPAVQQFCQQRSTPSTAIELQEHPPVVATVAAAAAVGSVAPPRNSLWWRWLPVLPGWACTCLDLLLLAGLAWFICGALVTSWRIFPEDPYLWRVSVDQTFRDVCNRYVSFQECWYRPTQFFIVPWVLRHFVDWHNYLAFRLASFGFLLGSAGTLYFLTRTLLNNSRMAGILAALYYVSHPAQHGGILAFFIYDHAHAMFVLLTVLFYVLSQRRSGWKAVWLTALAVLLYVVALTCKEITLVTPVYLGALSVLAILARRWPILGSTAQPEESWPSAVRREVWRLTPFVGLMLLYYWLHMYGNTSLHASGDYRTGFDWRLVWGNLRIYPLWIARIFCFPHGAFKYWFNANINTHTTWLGLSLTALVVCGWSLLWRIRREYRPTVLAALAWVGVFSTIPVWCGGYGHHIVLPLAGYAVLVGGVAWGLVRLFGAGRWAYALPVLICVGLAWVGRANIHEYVAGGGHYFQTTLAGQALRSPPVPADRIGASALIYIEDVKKVGKWSYCNECLFTYIYDKYHKGNIQEVVVPPMEEVSSRQIDTWLAHPNAFMVSYDEKTQTWSDRTGAFRAFASNAAARRPAAAR